MILSNLKRSLRQTLEAGQEPLSELLASLRSRLHHLKQPLAERYFFKCEKCGAFYFSTDKFLDHSRACNPGAFNPKADTATPAPASQPEWMETEP